MLRTWRSFSDTTKLARSTLGECLGIPDPKDHTESAFVDLIPIDVLYQKKGMKLRSFKVILHVGYEEDRAAAQKKAKGSVEEAARRSLALT